MNRVEQGVAAVGEGRNDDHLLPLDSISLAEYAKAHAAAGYRAYPGGEGTWWLQYEIGALMRFPIFVVSEPSEDELSGLYWSRWAPLVTYLVEPSAARPANAFMYLCADQQYALKGLDHGAQGNVKRGLRELELRSITLEQVMRFGERAFVDTWRRHGWVKVSPAGFREYCQMPARLCGNRFFGAWWQDELVAFAGVIEADGWAEIRVRFSTDASMKLRPNDALLFQIVSHYLVERGFRLVSAGASSIAPAANTPGQHTFKVKLGFTAVPVRRCFCFHPVLRPFLGRWSLGLFSGVAKTLDPSPRLVLAEYAFRQALGISSGFATSQEMTGPGIRPGERCAQPE